MVSDVDSPARGALSAAFCGGSVSRCLGVFAYPTHVVTLVYRTTPQARAFSNVLTTFAHLQASFCRVLAR